MKRPKPFSVGEVRLRAVRGPKDGGQWYWRADRYEGTSSKHGIKVWTGWGTKREASQAVAGLVAQGADLRPSPTIAHSGTVQTVRDLMECWLYTREARGDLQPGTKTADRVCGSRIVREIGDIHVDRLVLSVLERYRDDALHRDVASATVRLDFSKLGLAWTWARERGHVGDRDLRLPAVRLRAKRERYTPSRREIAATLEHLTGWRRTFVQTLATTGARLGEIADLKWGDLDLTEGTIKVDGKTGERWIPITDRDLRERLIALRPECPRPSASVWPVARGSIQGKLGRQIARACEQAGVHRWTPHGLRRFVATELISNGVDVRTAADILGHTPEMLLRVYAHSTPTGRRDAVRRTLGGFGDAEVIELAAVAGDRRPAQPHPHNRRKSPEDKRKR